MGRPATDPMNERIGKSALVTGGSRGIGAATAVALAERGADIAFTYKSSEDPAARVVKEIEALGRKATRCRSTLLMRWRSRMAAPTSRIRIGTTVTPVPRRLPWKLADEAAALDHVGRTVHPRCRDRRPRRPFMKRVGEPTEPRLRSRPMTSEPCWPIAGRPRAST